jgi:hypothetical protein
MESANLAQYEKTLADQQFLGGYVLFQIICI